MLLSLSLTPGAKALNGQTLALESGFLSFQAVDVAPDDSLQREAWIKEAVAVLRTKAPDQCDVRLDQRIVEGEGYRQVSYSLRNQEGCITFSNGEWLMLLVHSGHSNEIVGDITLAIDHRGRLYMNEGHVCGGIIAFYTHEDVSIDSVADFIRFCQSDTDDKAWTTIE